MKTSMITMLLTASFGVSYGFQKPMHLTSTSLNRHNQVKSMNDLYSDGRVTSHDLSSHDISSVAPPTNKVAPPGSAAESSIIVQGGSLRTWSYQSPFVEQVQVVLSTEGRPLEADIELWHGPDNTPCKMRVYVENGKLRPFSAVVPTPRGPNTVAIRNIGQLEFPFTSDVESKDVEVPSSECLASSLTIQGGALRTYQFEPIVDAVQVLLNTDGRPLNARIELLQGPNNNKQVVELYTEDGLDRPFFCILKTPGSGNVVRVVNTAPLEFPMSAAVVADSINKKWSSNAVIGGNVAVGGNISR